MGHFFAGRYPEFPPLDQTGLDRDPGLGQRDTIARDAVLGRGCAGRARQHRDPLVAQADQVLDQSHRTGEGIAKDRVNPPALDVPIDDHGGNVAIT